MRLILGSVFSLGSFAYCKFASRGEDDMIVKELADRLGLEEEEMAELLQLFVKTASADIDGLKAALQANDAEQVHVKAHTIKGSSGNMGLTDIYELAMSIDEKARVGSLDGLDDKFNQLVAAFDQLVGSLP